MMQPAEARIRDRRDDSIFIRILFETFVVGFVALGFTERLPTAHHLPNERVISRRFLAALSNDFSIFLFWDFALPTFPDKWIPPDLGSVHVRKSPVTTHGLPNWFVKGLGSIALTFSPEIGS